MMSLAKTIHQVIEDSQRIADPIWSGRRAAVTEGSCDRIYGLNLDEGTALDLGLICWEVSPMPPC